MNIKKGDTVKIISGNHKNQTGKVLKVLVKTNRVVVEGMNVASRHTKPSNSQPNGGIVKKEMPMDASNVQLIDPSTNKAGRIGFKAENGKKVRVFKKTNTVLDK
ncbi:MAG: 50S ribosomal protein L24 [Bacilli bacterium]|nr:50S ribosomal protein L24 [Bacilli bacterium]